MSVMILLYRSMMAVMSSLLSSDWTMNNVS
jgi:hypothetical protein